MPSPAPRMSTSSVTISASDVDTRTPSMMPGTSVSVRSAMHPDGAGLLPWMDGPAAPGRRPDALGDLAIAALTARGVGQAYGGSGEVDLRSASGVSGETPGGRLWSGSAC